MKSEYMDRAFGALSDATRRAILERLLEGDASVAELAAPFDITPRAVSKHLGVLEAAGLVTRSKVAQQRPSRICVAPLIEIDHWLGAYRALWNERFDRLEQRLAPAEKETK